jgi:hypothetical protein
MKYHLVSAALIAVALILFLSGISAAGTYLGALLITSAVVCEINFWKRLFRRPVLRQ